MRRILCLAAAVLCLLRQPVPVLAAQPESRVLVEVSTGRVLSEEGADIRRPVGSLVKLMTAYLTGLAVEEGRLDTQTVLTAGQEVAGMQGAVIWLEPGDTVSVHELLLGLITGNAGDAAAVLACAVSGSTERFVMDMNAAGFDLGMRSTRFADPQGFDRPDSYSTARDMARLACAVLRCEVLAPYLDVWRTFIRGDRVELVNENTLTRTLEGCRGLKAAHSEAAGYSVIAAAEEDGMCCAAVVLGCTDEAQRFSAARSLLHRGFAGYRVVTPGFSEEFLRPMRIRGGTQSAVIPHIKGLAPLAVPAGAQTQAVLVQPEYVEAPVREGQVLGRVYFYAGDTLLEEAVLVCPQEIPRLTLGVSLRDVLHLLFS